MPNPLNSFCDELDALVKRYRAEADFSYAEVIGALYMKSMTLMQEAQERADEILPDIMDLQDGDDAE
jgi:hypothetical protein